jgi:hypothetical protein
MGFRFSRRIKIAPGIRLNLSKSGVSTSLGRRGAWVTLGSKGTRTTIGIPGTGISYTETSGSHRARQSSVQSESQPEFNLAAWQAERREIRRRMLWTIAVVAIVAATITYFHSH